MLKALRDSEVWCVTNMGRVLQRGMTHQQAERYAAYLQHGMDSHRGGTRIPMADFNIAPDRDAMADHEQGYRAAKRHTTVGI